MIEPTPLHSDHAALLALAQNAFLARDNRALWRGNTKSAAKAHGAACDALWDELERQTVIQDGRLPVIDHPSVKQIKMIAGLRHEIVQVAIAAMEHALQELADGPMLEGDDE